jgi:hypothetical protein
VIRIYPRGILELRMDGTKFTIIDKGKMTPDLGFLESFEAESQLKERKAFI